MNIYIAKGIIATSLSTFFLSCMPVFASGGVGLGATRLVYHESDKQISLSIRNTSAETPFLIQSSALDASSKKTDDFIVTPPLFLLNPKKENLVRIMYVGPKLSEDRETIFYISSRAIPSTPKENNKNSLKVALQSVIKMFWRPDNLPVSVSDAPALLRCSYSASGITVNNPTPYYITLAQVSLGSTSLKNQMIDPKSQYTFSVSNPKSDKLKYRTINDFGAMTSEITCHSQ